MKTYQYQLFLIAYIESISKKDDKTFYGNYSKDDMPKLMKAASFHTLNHRKPTVILMISKQE